MSAAANSGPDAAYERARNQARKRARWNLVPWVLILAIVAVLALQAANEFGNLLAPPSADWSRPLTLGTVPSNHSQTQVALPDGKLLVFWAQDKGIRTYRVSPQGTVEATTDLLTDQAAPNSIQAMRIGNQIQLFWLEFQTQTVLTATVAIDGLSASAPSVVTSGATAYAAAPGGQPLAPWILAVKQDGVRFLTRTEAGGLWQQAITPGVPGAAEFVSLQGAQDGTLYGVTSELQKTAGFSGAIFSLLRLSPDGQFAVMPLARRRLEDMKEAVGTLALGLDQQNGYLFWDVARNDRGQRTTLAEYVTWPLQAEIQAPLEPQPFKLDPDAMPPASAPASLSPAPGQGDQLVVAVPATVGGGRDRVVETLEVIFRNGAPIAQRLAGPAASITLQPQPVQAGTERWLTWVVPEGTGATLRVASTQAPFRAATGKISPQDWEDAVGTTLVNTGYAYLPLVVSLLWLLPALMAVILAHFVAMTWAERNQLWINLGALAVFAAGKLYVAQLMLFKPMRVAAMPPWLGQHAPLVILVTVLIAILESFRRDRHWYRQSVAAGFLPLALYDMVLTALLVGPYMH